MPIPYKKPYTQGKRATSGGPRDQQRRQLQDFLVDQNQIDLIDSLKEQIKLLKDTPKVSQFTDEQIDNEIVKAVKEETIKYRELIKDLESENDKLKNELENKNILIEQLREISSRAVEVQSISDRPEIKPIFIDPIEKEFKSVESHIKIEEVSNTGKDDTVNKVTKLKELLGKV
jgi:TolA-binding protein